MLVRLLLWLIVGFLVYTVVQALKQMLLKPPGPPAEKTTRGEEMVQDPECGTYVPRTDAVKDRIDGETRYFCSSVCRDKFRARN